MDCSYLTHLECTRTGKHYDADQLHNLSEEGAPLAAVYDLEKAREELSPDTFRGRENNMWKYRELLPVRNLSNIVSLDEGGTPLMRSTRMADRAGLPGLMIKDESTNPTGSFKARGIAAAISAARERGAKSFAMPSAGNAGGALAAYAAAAGMESHIFMPTDTPLAFRLECEYYDTNLQLVDGLISDCGVKAQEACREDGHFNVSTLKEPYRLEGKKTMGLELAEQLGWSLPDVIIYPTGGGTGLIGMWKAFKELKELGWVEGPLPRMVSVQSAGCAPIVRAFEEGRKEARYWENAETISSGLRVPSAIGDFIILDILRESNGTAIAVTDEETLDFSLELASHTGIFPAPEGGATLAALHRMRERSLVDDDEQVVLFNTGSGYKYLEALNRQSDVARSFEEMLRN